MKEKNFNIGNTTIIIRESIPNDVDIRKCYDVCNELFRDNEGCFYTKNETRNMNLLVSQKQKRESIG